MLGNRGVFMVIRSLILIWVESLPLTKYLTCNTCTYSSLYAREYLSGPETDLRLNHWVKAQATSRHVTDVSTPHTREAAS